MTPLAATADHFDTLFGVDSDPWGTRTRWYEARKRALTLAALPHARYGRAFEPGCAAGELTAALATRCDRVEASDASAAAVSRARRRLGELDNVHLTQARVPQTWPTGRFDLVVVSELGYYLCGSELVTLGVRCIESLAADGVLLACHWRRPAEDFVQSADAVHARLRTTTGLHSVAHYEDADCLIDVWSRNVRSVAQCEGLA
jgi:trans-aconitate methyltransferase